MAGRVDHFGVDCADFETLAVLEEMIEFGAIARYVRGVEDRPEDFLHILDMFANRNRSAGLQLDIGRAGQVVGVRMRLQDLLDGDAEPFCFGKYFVRGFHGCVTAAMIEIEHRIDHRAFFRRRIPDQIAHHIGGLVEKCLDLGFGGCGHGALL